MLDGVLEELSDRVSTTFRVEADGEIRALDGHVRVRPGRHIGDDVLQKRTQFRRRSGGDRPPHQLLDPSRFLAQSIDAVDTLYRGREIRFLGVSPNHVQLVADVMTQDAIEDCQSLAAYLPLSHVDQRDCVTKHVVVIVDERGDARIELSLSRCCSTGNRRSLGQRGDRVFGDIRKRPGITEGLPGGLVRSDHPLFVVDDNDRFVRFSECRPLAPYARPRRAREEVVSCNAKEEAAGSRCEPPCDQRIVEQWCRWTGRLKHEHEDNDREREDDTLYR